MGQEWKVSFTPGFENDLATLFPDKADAERFRAAMLADVAARIAESEGFDEPVTFVDHDVPGQDPLEVLKVEEVARIPLDDDRYAIFTWQGSHPLGDTPPTEWRWRLYRLPYWITLVAVALIGGYVAWRAAR